MSWNLNKWANEPWAWVDGVFTEVELDRIVTTFLDKKSLPATVGPNGKNDRQVRDSSTLFIYEYPENHFIYNKLGDATEYLNTYFKYDLTHFEPPQFTTYKTGQYYAEHWDMGYEVHHDRKLSLVLQLTNETEYDGGELILYNGSHANPVEMSKKRGRIMAFPSWMLHEVKPITKGKRHSLVAWVCGPRFK